MAIDCESISCVFIRMMVDPGYQHAPACAAQERKLARLAPALPANQPSPRSVIRSKAPWQAAGLVMARIFHIADHFSAGQESNLQPNQQSE
jgi:hypothetical protein